MKWFDAQQATLHNRRGDSLPVTIAQCGEEEAGVIMALQERVIAALPDKSLLALTDMNQIEESLREDVCTGVYHEGDLIAFSLMIINRPTPRHVAWKLDCDEKTLSGCVTFDAIFVQPDYRGYGIQRLLWEPLLPLARKMGANRAHATISPDNPHSLENTMAFGFEVVARKTMYGGRDRFILECLL